VWQLFRRKAFLALRFLNARVHDRYSFYALNNPECVFPTALANNKAKYNPPAVHAHNGVSIKTGQAVWARHGSAKLSAPVAWTGNAAQRNDQPAITSQSCFLILQTCGNLFYKFS
jgi:hypothetical protein